MIAQGRREVLRVDDLTTTFPGDAGPILAVDRVSFHVHEGEILGVVGESGSGKSVTALSLMRLLPDTAHHPSGRVVLCGRDLFCTPKAGMSAVRGRDIAMIFQEPMTSLNPVMRIGDQILEALHRPPLRTRREAEQAAVALLEEVGIEDAARRLDAFPHELSGGQRQRVMIAMALAGEPRILIADEPTTALDVTVQARLLTLLRAACARRRMAMVFVSHDLGVIAQIADRIVVMRAGRIVEQGETRAVFSNPQHPYTRGLIACRPAANPDAVRLPTVEDPPGPSTTPTPPDPRPTPPASQLSPLLEVDALTVRFPTARDGLGRVTRWLSAVDQVSLSVPAGTTLGLVGGSGCGKTTLARAILGLITPHAGQIRFDGERIAPHALPRRAELRLRRSLQVVFQDPGGSLNPRQTVEALLCEPMQVHGIGATHSARRERAAALLHEVGLEADHLRRYPHAFSGGQRQRIAIARALSLSPRLIICDEAVSALDVSVQARILNLLRDLQQRRGLAYLFISHDLSVVRFMADHLAVMQAGRIVETAPAAQLWRAPQHPCTQALIAAVPRL